MPRRSWNSRRRTSADAMTTNFGKAAELAAPTRRVRVARGLRALLLAPGAHRLRQLDRGVRLFCDRGGRSRFPDLRRHKELSPSRRRYRHCRHADHVASGRRRIRSLRRHHDGRGGNRRCLSPISFLGWPIWASICLQALVVAAMVGTVNGVLVVRFGIPSFLGDARHDVLPARRDVGIDAAA